MPDDRAGKGCLSPKYPGSSLREGPRGLASRAFGARLNLHRPNRGRVQRRASWQAVHAPTGYPGGESCCPRRTCVVRQHLPVTAPDADLHALLAHLQAQLPVTWDAWPGGWPDQVCPLRGVGARIFTCGPAPRPAQPGKTARAFSITPFWSKRCRSLRRHLREPAGEQQAHGVRSAQERLSWPSEEARRRCRCSPSS